MRLAATPRRRVVLFGVAALVAINVAAYVLDALSGARPGPESSSYTTSPRGLAAYAELLQRNGHPVARLRADLAGTAPPSTATVVVLDAPGLPTDEARSLARFVDAGGRLIAGGTSPAWLEDVMEDAPVWVATGPQVAAPVAPAPEVASVGEVRAAGAGGWSDPGGSLPILGDGSAAVASVAVVGEGRAVLLADSSVLHNERLDEADNAAFGIVAAGERGRPVYFVESVHGYAQAGLEAVPSRWKWALAGFAAAALTFMAAKARRLGGPDQAARDLPPPRREFVDAVAGILARSRDYPRIGSTLQRAVVNRLRQRPGPATSVDQSARAAGLSEESARALAAPVSTERDVMVLARALAALERKSAGISAQTEQR